MESFTNILVVYMNKYALINKYIYNKKNNFKLFRGTISKYLEIGILPGFQPYSSIVYSEKKNIVSTFQIEYNSWQQKATIQ